MMLKPIRLLPSFREKIWGAQSLSPWFAETELKIGEVWFSAPDNETALGPRLGELARELGGSLFGSAVEPQLFPILVKFIFTTERLSIQVHPNDAHAAELEGLPGKTEMWHILRAEPGAEIALGLREKVSPERLEQAALSGEIEDLLRWVRVEPGDTYFIHPGTVHAIGAGVVLCEVQQYSDLTYRLYDYGRPRPLHIEKSLKVANLGPHPGRSTPMVIGGGVQMLASCRYFATERLSLNAAFRYRPDPERCHFLIVLEGGGSLGGACFHAGEVWLVPADADSFILDVDRPVELLRTYVPKTEGY